MSRRHLAALGIALAALVPYHPPSPAGAQATPVFDHGRAVAFLKASQQTDGGFETAGFPGFETPDAALALAEAAQTGPTWNPAQGRAAVQAVVRNGRTPLDALDNLAETTTSPGQAAKLIVLVAAPLGYNPASFDPQGDGATDLVAKMDAGRNENGSFGPAGAFNATLYAAVAHPLVGRAVPTPTRGYIRDAQQRNGGWNFAGNAAGTDVDVDTTGLALQALAASDVEPFTDTVRRAVGFLNGVQLPSGGWPAFGVEDPNATALGILGLTAAGRRVDTCFAGAPRSLAARQAADGHVASPNDASGVNTLATSQAVQALRRGWLPAFRVPEHCPDDGYRLVATDGGVFSFGASRFFGSTGGIKLNRPMVGIASTPGGQGYWLVASDGGVFAFGDARFRGSTGRIKLNRPVVGMAPTPTGRGYWLVATDGGVFSFGDAEFFGSTGAITLNQPIVGMASTSTGLGYWLVASDGGVFAFGDAVFRGSTGAIKLNRPVVAMSATPSGLGYWMVASDGGVFSFGDARFHGSSAGSATSGAGIVGMRTTFRGDGYVQAGADARTSTFSAGAPPTSTGPLRLNAPIVGVSE